MQAQEVREEERRRTLAAVVILNWNGWRDTIECLESLAEVNDIEFEIIIIDNGSTDDSAKIIKRWIKSNNFSLFESDQPRVSGSIIKGCDGDRRGLQRVHLYSLSENIGFCAGNNLGLEHALANGIPYALILNNDTLVDPRFLSRLIEYAQAHPDAGLIGGQIRYADDPKKIWWMGGRITDWLGFEYLYQNQPANEESREPFPTDWISGCMTLIPLAVYSRIGGYDEKFFIWCDEWDLSLRASRAGYKMAVVPSAIIFHKVGKTLGVLSPFTYYYSGRNLLITRRRYLPYHKWIIFSMIYIPHKFLQSILFTMKYRDPYYLFCWDMIHDFVSNRYGKWSRHDEVALNKRKKGYE